MRSLLPSPMTGAQTTRIITPFPTAFYSPVTGNSAPGWTAGKYYKQTSAGGAPINFMIVHKPAVIQFGKHTVSKVISPDANPDADAYIFSYRAYGLTDAYENKAAGIYCSHA